MVGDTLGLFGVADEEAGGPLVAPEAAPMRSLAEVAAKPLQYPASSFLDGKSGVWLDRKREWISTGIKSEIGRDVVVYATTDKEYWPKFGTEISVFDPVLCELAYTWYCPVGGQIVDPFAGGSVRGLVAGALGKRYWGCDLRKEQIAANEHQARSIIGTRVYGPDDVTPIEEHGGVRVKRDDYCTVAGISGGKVRTCYSIARKHKEAGCTTLVTASSRSSPQANIVATIARHLGMAAHCHIPGGDLGEELEQAQAKGAEIIQHRPGYNSVICARANTDAETAGSGLVPFGMECWDAVEQTRKQVSNIPADTKRIVMPVGSGMSLAGVLHGLVDCNLDIPVVGIVVGADPTDRLNRYAPLGWQSMVTLIESGMDYGTPATTTTLHGIALDPYYEAKCVPFIEAGDLFWIVGIRPTLTAAVQGDAVGAVVPPVWVCGDSALRLDDAPVADFIFSCPPYGDLEEYSDDPSDLSNMDWADFLVAYRCIIGKAVARLRQDSFACFVVGDFRDKAGNYRNFVAETVRAFEDAGAALCDDAVLATPIGTAAFRVTRQFSAGRKMAKVHQNILVFCKGNVTAAAAKVVASAA